MALATAMIAGSAHISLFRGGCFAVFFILALSVSLLIHKAPVDIDATE